jgi:anti-sigma factor RsiW
MSEPEQRTDSGMDEGLCLFVLSLLMDERPVDPDLAARALAYAERHPHCARALADWREQSRALASTPGHRTSAGFTDRVLAAAGVGGSQPETLAPLLPFVRRLAAAAGLALAVTLGWELGDPDRLHADTAIERHRHAVDGFRSEVFAPDDILAGLQARLRDAEFGLARRGGSAP